MPTVAEMTGAKVAMVPVEVLEEARKAMQEVIAAWDRLYALINPRSDFPLQFADLAEDTEFRELQSARAALAKLESLTPSQPTRETV